jgi:hypothetical protein
MSSPLKQVMRLIESIGIIRDAAWKAIIEATRDPIRKWPP